MGMNEIETVKIDKIEENRKCYEPCEFIPHCGSENPLVAVGCIGSFVATENSDIDILILSE
jgi:hypothetical protein